MINPNHDGINHINVYSNGKTQLGQFLSNFYHHPITLPNLGCFQSIEGLWYYLLTGNEELKNLHGYAAKEYGKNFPIIQSLDKSIILTAIKLKIDTSTYKEQFINSHLPFHHYYVYGDKIIDKNHSSQWILDFLHEYRTELKYQNLGLN